MLASRRSTAAAPGRYENLVSLVWRRESIGLIGFMGTISCVVGVLQKSSVRSPLRTARGWAQRPANSCVGLRASGARRLREIAPRHPTDGAPILDLAPARVLLGAPLLVGLGQRGEFLEGEPALAAEAAQTGRVRGDAREQCRRRRRLRPQCHVAPGRYAAHAIEVRSVGGRLRGTARRHHRRGDDGERRAPAPSRPAGRGPPPRRGLLSRR